MGAGAEIWRRRGVLLVRLFPIQRPSLLEAQWLGLRQTQSAHQKNEPNGA